MFCRAFFGWQKGFATKGPARFQLISVVIKRSHKILLVTLLTRKKKKIDEIFKSRLSKRSHMNYIQREPPEGAHQERDDEFK